MHSLRRRYRAVASLAARTDIERCVGALVGTLGEAHALAARGSSGADLVKLLARAREELDAVDEKLLRLDRRSKRSVFRNAGRLRSRIDLLHDRFAR